MCQASAQNKSQAAFLHTSVVEAVPCPMVDLIRDLLACDMQIYPCCSCVELHEAEPAGVQGEVSAYAHLDKTFAHSAPFLPHKLLRCTARLCHGEQHQRLQHC